MNKIATKFIVRRSFCLDKVFTNYEEAIRYYESKLNSLLRPTLIGKEVLVNGNVISQLIIKKPLKKSLFCINA